MIENIVYLTMFFGTYDIFEITVCLSLVLVCSRGFAKGVEPTLKAHK